MLTELVEISASAGFSGVGGLNVLILFFLYMSSNILFLTSLGLFYAGLRQKHTRCILRVSVSGSLCLHLPLMTVKKGLPQY